MVKACMLDQDILIEQSHYLYVYNRVGSASTVYTLDIMDVILTNLP